MEANGVEQWIAGNVSILGAINYLESEDFALKKVFLLSLFCLIAASPAQAGYVKNGVEKGGEATKKGIKKSWDVTEKGTKKGVDVTVGVTKKGIKETKKGTGKAIDVTVGGTKKGLDATKKGLEKAGSSTKNFFKKVF